MMIISNNKDDDNNINNNGSCITYVFDKKWILRYYKQERRNFHNSCMERWDSVPLKFFNKK